MRHRVARRRLAIAKPETWTSSAPVGAASPDGTKRRMDGGRNGFTLVEVIVALGLFALIGVAGFSMLSGVLQTQERTESRLRRLSEIQRAVFVVNADLDQLSGQIDGGETRLVFQKTDLGGRPVVVRYDLRSSALFRTVSGPLGERSQPILGGVNLLQWSYRRRGGGWVSTASPPPSAPDLADPVPHGALTPAAGDGGVPAVAAVAMDLRLAGVDDRPVTVRRVVTVPEISP